MSHRIQQVNALLEQKLGEIFIKELEIPAEFFITIAKVDTAADLKTAKVWLSVLPFDKNHEAMAFIIRNRSLIQRELGKSWKLKFTPKINFLLDKTGEIVEEIDQLIENSKF
jgi:ribosome-binding factor A